MTDFYCAWLYEPKRVPSDAEVFAAWLNFGGGWTLEEFTLAYLSVQ